jgi:hydrogenase nickel incorporation protein HypA/HybF
MHEYALAESIVRAATKHSGGAKVVEICLVIGQSSHIMVESLQMYFDIFAENTLCADAVIKVETVVPKLLCKTCGAHFTRKPFCFECPCGGEGAPTEIGNEFYIKNITIEEGD